jgi:hypothetical protein
MSKEELTIENDDSSLRIATNTLVEKGAKMNVEHL